MDVLIWVLIGAIAGYLASRIFKKDNRGIMWYIIVGLLGSMLGGWLFSLFNIYAHSLLVDIISATVGAILLLFLLRKLLFSRMKG